MRPLVIITRELPPQICGIGTYSWLLQQRWPRELMPAQFLVTDGAQESIKALDYSKVAEFNSKSAALWRELDRIGPADILLHYAGRAYHRFGCPGWLPSVLAKWKRKFPGGRLTILFHELPGKFPITSRYYWIDLCNRRVVRRLARMADVIVTNTEDHAAKIVKISGRTDVHWFPVSSNIPLIESVTVPRAGAEFAIFGLPFGRWQTLQMFESQIRSWSASGRLTKLHLIGPSDEKFDAHSDQLIQTWPDPGVVTRHGMLSPADVSRLLARVQFGFSNATSENWSKSAVFMALAAHGCSVVSRVKSDTVPLCFTVAPDEVATISEVDLNERARSLQVWYQENADWNVIAKKIVALLPSNMEREAAA